MKQVSFEVAKALKEAGYPQISNCDKYVTKPCKGRYLWHTPNPDYTSESDDNEWYDFEPGEYVDHEMYGVSVANSVNAPTYIDVWLWLWREKNINIKDTRDGAIWIWIGDNSSIYLQVSRDPEEAIEAAIEYLVTNYLIK